MLGNNYSVSNSAGATNPQSAILKPIKIEQSVTVQKVVNGFVVGTQRQDEYKQDNHIASDVEEVAKIISTYFA